MYQHNKRRKDSTQKGVIKIAETASRKDRIPVERIQTGVRMERRLLKVLKALAEYHDVTLGDLLEGIVLHVFDGKLPFGEDSLHRIADLKKIYGLHLDAGASHRLVENRKSAMARGKS